MSREATVTVYIEASVEMDARLRNRFKGDGAAKRAAETVLAGTPVDVFYAADEEADGDPA